MKFALTLLTSILCLALVAGCQQKKKPKIDGPQKQLKKAAIDPAMLKLFKPLPVVFESKTNKLTEARIKLGRMLYFDKRLSKNHDISCNTCHDLKTWGVDNKPTSPGHKKQLGDRNSPTVYNAAGHLAQFWDGRSPHVEHQATQPILNPVEMAMPKGEDVMKVLASIPAYVELFKKAFPGEKQPLTYANLGNAIGAFERKLVTRDRFDAFLKGDKKALTKREKQGFNAFVGAGCTACHTGSLLGGHLYQKVGLVKPWPKQTDLGRFKVTKKDADKMIFKVPSLRNIEKTAPYMHDGSVKTLDEAIKLMAWHQLGKKLEPKQVALIADWLKTLTGKLPLDYIKEPKLPPSGPNTPKPNPS